MVEFAWRKTLTIEVLGEHFRVLGRIMGTEILMCFVVYLYLFIFGVPSMVDHHSPNQQLRDYKPTMGFLSNFCLPYFIALGFLLCFWWAKPRPYILIVVATLVFLAIGAFTNAFYWTYTVNDLQTLFAFVFVMILFGLGCNYYIHYKRIKQFGVTFKELYLPMVFATAIMGGYVKMIGFLIGTHLIIVQLAVRLIIHQLAIYAIRFCFWLGMPEDDKTYHSYGRYFILYCPQYVSAFIGRWIINNSGDLHIVAIVTIASALQGCILQCLSLPAQEYFRSKGGMKEVKRILSKGFAINNNGNNNDHFETVNSTTSVSSSTELQPRSPPESPNPKGVVLVISDETLHHNQDREANMTESTGVQTKELTNNNPSAPSSPSSPRATDKRKASVWCGFIKWPEGEESMATKVDLKDDDWIDSDDIISAQAVRTYENISRVCEETLAAPAFAIFLTNIRHVFYFPEGPSTVYFVWTALLQIGIQFFFDLITMIVLRAQGVSLKPVWRRRPKQFLILKVGIVLIATQFTLFCYEKHLNLLPKDGPEIKVCQEE